MHGSANSVKRNPTTHVDHGNGNGVSTKATILVVDDEVDTLDVVEHNLTREGYRVVRATTGEEALRLTESIPVDLILLDIMLPGLDGLDVCREIRNDPKRAHIPIIMVTAKDQDEDIVIGLELGADDYITKPFSVKVLVARIKITLRKRRKESTPRDAVYKVEGLTVHAGRQEATLNGETLHLTATEFRILNLLVSRPGWAFSRAEILESVWGEESCVADRSIDVHIVNLRRKLAGSGQNIETVRGFGYRYRD